MENSSVEVAPDVLALISSTLAWELEVVPYEANDKEVCFYAHNPDVDQKKLLRFQLNRDVHFTDLPPDKIRKLLSRYYRDLRGEVRQIELNSIDGNRFVELLIQEAERLSSSDIHVEIFESFGRVRIRVDGHLLERYRIKKAEYASLVNRIKIQSSLDIAEKRLPQDGRISYRRHQRSLDIRVSIVPTLYGEKVVLRLLNNDVSKVSISEVGMDDELRSIYLKGVEKPHGIVLISGPTGSGKTTTLYATLKRLNLMERNIMTVEDPIEYTLEGVNQVQLKENIGLDFSTVLRTFLRQDPDVIMLGEIRDEQTAEISIRAALTGHLVLATIHTNSALDIVSRLRDLGMPLFLLSTTLNTLVAQRLVRRLCNHCKEPMDSQSISELVIKPPKEARVHRSVGCEHCYFTGYKGRVALFEVLQIDENLQEEIKAGMPTGGQYLNSYGLNSLKEDALQKFYSGITSIEEISLYL